MKFNSIALAAVTMLACSGAASAGVQVITFNADPAPSSAWGTDGTYTPSFAYFDPALGTLVGVQVTETGTISQTGGTVHNGASSLKTGSVGVYGVFTLGTDAGSPAPIDSASSTFTLSFNTLQNVSVPAHGALPLQPVPLASYSATEFFSTPTELAAFTGPGSYTLDFSLGVTPFLLSTTRLSLDPSPTVDAGGTIEISYFYTGTVSVPAPPVGVGLSSFAFLVLGFLAKGRKSEAGARPQ